MGLIETLYFELFVTQAI